VHRRLAAVSTLPAPPTSPSPSGSGPTTPVSGSGAVPAWVRPALMINLIAEIGIVVTGGLVRLTGSGLGCPTWPRCVPGSFTPVAFQAQGYHKYIEFGNRLLTSVVSLAALAALMAAVVFARRTGASRRIVALGSTPLVLVAVQAVVGGISVRVGLSPISVATHFLVSMVLVAASALLWLATGRSPVPTGRREVRWITAGVGVLAAVVLVLGTVVTGSGPHSGDADRPTRFGFNPRDVSWLHADAVWLFVGLVVALALAVRLTGADAVLRRRVIWLLAVTLAQGVIGYVQYALHVPILLVMLHMLGASLLVVAVTAVSAGVVGTDTLTRAGAFTPASTPPPPPS
jgi:cytochrome c oxidase assembly protein subunit 15